MPHDYPNAAEWKWRIRDEIDGIPNNYEAQALHIVAWNTWHEAHDPVTEVGTKDIVQALTAIANQLYSIKDHLREIRNLMR